MRTEIWFVCEACGTRYLSRRLAEACEATVLPESPVKPGDAVGVKERYDGPQPDVVVAVSVAASPWAVMLSGLEDGHATVERHLANPGAHPLHRRLIQVGERHQMGKDPDTFVDEVLLSDLVVDGHPLAEVA